jgi:hypothetical protein
MLLEAGERDTSAQALTGHLEEVSRSENSVVIVAGRHVIWSDTWSSRRTSSSVFWPKRAVRASVLDCWRRPVPPEFPPGQGPARLLGLRLPVSTDRMPHRDAGRQGRLSGRIAELDVLTRLDEGSTLMPGLAPMRCRVLRQGRLLAPSARSRMLPMSQM